jgi:hypothetical protein
MLLTRSDHKKTPAAYLTARICQGWPTAPQLSYSLRGSTVESENRDTILADADQEVLVANEGTMPVVPA